MNILYVFYAISPLILKYLFEIIPQNPIFQFSLLVLSIIYWIFVGSEFSKLSLPKYMGIALGNIFFIIDGILFLFVLRIPTFLNHFIKTAYSLWYPVLNPLLSLLKGLNINQRVFDNLIEYIGIVSFIIFFSVAYFYTRNRHKRSRYTFSKNLF